MVPEIDFGTFFFKGLECYSGVVPGNTECKPQVSPAVSLALITKYDATAGTSSTQLLVQELRWINLFNLPWKALSGFIVQQALHH